MFEWLRLVVTISEKQTQNRGLCRLKEIATEPVIKQESTLCPISVSVRALQKCASRAQIDHLGALASTLLRSKNDKWDTPRSHGLNGHAHAAAIVSPQDRKCS